MYGWIWRVLPGGLAGKLVGSAALLIGALALLFYVVFPRVEPLMPYENSGVTPSTGAAAPASPTPASPTATP